MIVHFAFPPYDFILAAPLGLAIFYRAAPRNFLSGYLFGLGFFTPMLFWLGTFHPLAPIGVVLILALPYGVASLVDRAPLSFATAITAAEFVRSIGIFALPWGVLGTLAADFQFRSLAAYIGVFGVTFLIAWISAMRPTRAVAVVVVLFLGTLPHTLPHTRLHVVGIIQGNFPISGDYEFQPRAVLDHLLRETRSLAAQGAETIVWTETVILEYLNRPDSRVRHEISELARQTGAVIVVGAPAVVSQTDKRNAAFFFSPDGRVTRYDKVHLVPFGEFLPGYGPGLSHTLLPRGTGDFSAAVLPAPVDDCGPLICYESVLPYIAKGHIDRGARILINLSNDAWSKSAAEAEQHFDLARMRSAELMRPLIRAGNVGPSAIIDAGGRVIAELPAYERGSIIAGVRLSDTRTVVSIFGEWVGWLAFLGLPFVLTVRQIFVGVS